MSQRFSAGQTLLVTLTVSDQESSIAGVSMSYSTDGSGNWQPLAVTQSDSDYSAAIEAGSAISVSLWYTVTDTNGNYLAFRTSPAALLETPVVLDVDVDPTAIPLTSDPFTLTISGTLRDAENQPLSQAACLIPVYLNDQLAGYVNDLIRHEDGTYETGIIDFDWTFIPTDFISQTGWVPIKFVFDLGTYAPQEVMHNLAVTPCVLFGDLDGDGDVDVGDIMLVASRWRMTDDDPNWEARYDLDGDGIITIVDIMLVAAHWGETCG